MLKVKKQYVICAIFLSTMLSAQCLLVNFDIPNVEGDLSLLKSYLTNSSLENVVQHLQKLYQENELIARNFLSSFGEIINKMRDQYGRNIFHIAVINADLGVARIIADTFKDALYSRDCNGMTALMMAAYLGNEEMVMMLLRLAGTLVGNQEYNQEYNYAQMASFKGVIALDYAVLGGNVAIVQRIITLAGNSANNWISSKRFKATPLYFAARNGFFDIVKVLLKDIDPVKVQDLVYAQADNGRSAFDVSKGHSEIRSFFKSIVQQNSNQTFLFKPSGFECGW